MPDDSSEEARSAPTLDQFWAETEGYLSSADRSDAAPRERLKATAAAFFDLKDSDAVYVAKATQAGYRNQVWQGQAVSRANDIMLLVDKTGNEQGIADAAKSRLNPLPENGFDSVVICEQDAHGWKIRGAVEYEHTALGEELQKSDASIAVIRVPDPASGNAQQSIGEALHVARGTTDDLVAHLQEAKNIILGGPPGTSKTHLAFQIVEALAGVSSHGLRLENLLKGREWHEVPISELQAPEVVWEFIQLHPSYTYEDFVRGLRTDPDGIGFSLISVDGILPVISHVAAARRGKPTVLIIDELNRCNLPVVFGETIFAIDPSQRGRPIRLQYEGSETLSTTLRVPPELLVIGTMNTADRSIAALDFAVRRRFRFLFLGPSEGRLEEYYSLDSRRAAVAIAFLRATNSIVLDREIQVGHSYFMVGPELSASEWRKALTHKIVYEVCPLLREYDEEGRLAGSTSLSVNGFDVDLLSTPDHALSAVLGEVIGSMAPDE